MGIIERGIILEFPTFGREGSVTLVEGKKRSGKTLFIVLLTLIYADKGIKGFSNFHIKSPNVKKIDFFEFFELLEKPPFLPFTYCSLQEMYGWYNSHRSMSNDSEGADMVNFQGGKKNINFVGDTQILGRALESMREMANFRFEAEKDTLNHEFVYHELDITYPDDTVYTDDDFVISFDFAKKMLFDRYDTVEYSKPVFYDEVRLKMLEHQPERYNAEIQRQVELVFTNRDKFGIRDERDCKTVRVSNALLMLGVPDALASKVSDRLSWQFEALLAKELKG